MAPGQSGDEALARAASAEAAAAGEGPAEMQSKTSAAKGLRLPPALIALSPGDLEQSDCVRFLAAVRRALDAGLRGILLRERNLSDRVYAELLQQLLVRCASFDAWVAVHDRAHMLAPSNPGGAQVSGLHLGFRSLTPVDARKVSGPLVALGLSTHAADERSTWSGADYIFHGPVNQTPSKAGWQEPVGYEGLRLAVDQAAELGAAKVWAIGGLLPGDAAQVRSCGAGGMAILRGIFGQGDSQDPGVSTEQYLAAWGMP